MGRLLAEQHAHPTDLLVTANVQEAISARLLRLSPQAVRLLEAASIAGNEFALSVMAAMVDLPLMRCLAPIDEAVAAGLVEPASTPGTQQFAHALIRDAIEAGLGTLKRVRLHRRAAEAVEELFGDHLGPRLFDLARRVNTSARRTAANRLYLLRPGGHVTDPLIAEPLFHHMEATVEFIPVMNADDPRGASPRPRRHDQLDTRRK